MKRPRSESSHESAEASLATREEQHYETRKPHERSSNGNGNGEDDENDDDDAVGFGPTLPVAQEQSRTLPHARAYLAALPRSPRYRLSYMHRNLVTRLIAAHRVGFLISASADGQLKFWARASSNPAERPVSRLGMGTSSIGKGSQASERLLVFAKQFRPHSGSISAMALSYDDSLLVTVSAMDRVARVFHVRSFDMIGFAKLDFVPGSAVVFYVENETGVMRFAVAHSDEPCVSIFACHALEEKPFRVTLPHVSPVVLMRYNLQYRAIISVDTRGVVEYWAVDTLRRRVSEQLEEEVLSHPGSDEDKCDGDGDGDGDEVGGVKNHDLRTREECIDESACDSSSKLLLSIPGVKFDMKFDTDLFEFAKQKATPTSLELSSDGTQFVCMGDDRIIRVFHFETGKLRRSYDESLSSSKISSLAVSSGRPAGHASNGHGDGASIAAANAAMEADFQRRMAREQSISADSNGALSQCNVIFDHSGHFLLYATPFGIKIVNVATNRVSRILGRHESAERFLSVALFQEASSSGASKRTKDSRADPLLVATAYDSQRIYLFTSTEPPDDEERDVFNERPMPRNVSGSQHASAQNISAGSALSTELAKRVTLHTTAGDITFTTMTQCSKTVENFTVHAKNGYFDGVMYVGFFCSQAPRNFLCKR